MVAQRTVESWMGTAEERSRFKCLRLLVAQPEGDEEGAADMFEMAF